MKPLITITLKEEDFPVRACSKGGVDIYNMTSVEMTNVGDAYAVDIEIYLDNLLTANEEHRTLAPGETATCGHTLLGEHFKVIYKGPDQKKSYMSNAKVERVETPSEKDPSWKLVKWVIKEHANGKTQNIFGRWK